MKPFRFIIRNYLFWMIFFHICRVAFVFYHWNFFPVGYKGLPLIFVHSLVLDTSTACYLLGFPFLLIVAELLITYSLSRFHSIYHKIVIPLVALVFVIHMEVFSQWGTPVNFQALSYIRYPKEVLASIWGVKWYVLIPLLALLIYIGLWLYRIMVQPLYKNLLMANSFGNMLLKTLNIIVIAFLLITGMRGGLQLSPVNQSFAYFSERPVYNNAALNPLWNVFDTMLKSEKQEDFHFFSDAELVSKLPKNTGTPIPDITLKARPNVVVVILESLSADLLTITGGEGVCPNIERFASEGLVFKNAYSSGDRTDKGIVAILSGFPAQPGTSIIKQPARAMKLPNLGKLFKEKGYHTSFYYGGESEFFNLKAYLLNGGFEKISDLREFPSGTRRSKWGVFDGDVFNLMEKDLKAAHGPFFSVILTLTNHEPFEIPDSKEVPSNPAEKIRRTARYTDTELGNFMKKVSTMPWFQNTLFVFVADHGHRYPKDYGESLLPGRFHIPVIFWGPALNPALKNKSSEAIVSQTDIAPTLGRIVDRARNNFPWGNPLVLEGNGRAFYSFNYGFGWVCPQGKYILDLHQKKVVYRDPENAPDAPVDSARAYLQWYMQTYFKF